MLILLSPAKRLIEPPAAAAPHTRPALLDDANALADVARRLSSVDLQALMGISEALGDLNHARFQQMEGEPTPDNARQAILSFAGEVYQGLDAGTLSAEDLAWAQDHVAILSGLYGVLRPLDLVQPYRLEMGTSLDNPRGADLYAWWGDRVTEELGRREADTIVNLASTEYFRVVRPKRLQARVVTPVFQDVKDGKARTLGFFAKKARGMMTRWAIERRITDADALKTCDAGGYTVVPEASTGTRWVFRRPQPPPVSR